MLRSNPEYKAAEEQLAFANSFTEKVEERHTFAL